MSEQEFRMPAGEILPVAGKPNSDPEFEFDAFVSYSRADDYGLVRRLKVFLEGFHRRGFASRARLKELNLCVDGSSFSIAKLRKEASRKSADRQTVPETELEALIAGYLDRCRYFLMLCPGERPGQNEESGSFGSRNWRHWELEYFLSKRGPDAVLLVVTHGDKPWASPSEFFPPKVVESQLHRKLWYDLRAFYKQQAKQWSKVSNFSEEQLRLAADLNHESADKIQKLYQIEELQRQRKRTTVFATVAVTLAVTGIFALYQMFQARKAHEAESVARHTAETNLIHSRAIAAVSEGQVMIERDPALAFAFAIRSMELMPSSRARSLISTSLRALPTFNTIFTERADNPKRVELFGEKENTFQFCRFLADGKTLLVWGERRRVEAWDINESTLSPFGNDDHPAKDVAVSASGEWVAIATGTSTALYQVSSNAPPRLIKSVKGGFRKIAVSQDGARVLLLDRNQRLQVVEMRSEHSAPIAAVAPLLFAFSRSGERLMVLGKDGLVAQFEVSGKLLSSIANAGSGQNNKTDDLKLLVAALTNRVAAVDAGGEPIPALTLSGQFTISLMQSAESEGARLRLEAGPDDDSVFVVRETDATLSVELFDFAHKKSVHKIEGRFSRSAVSPDGAHVSVVGPEWIHTFNVVRNGDGPGHRAAVCRQLFCRAAVCSAVGW